MAANVRVFSTASDVLLTAGTFFVCMQACWDAVMTMPGVKADPAFLSAFGNSRASYAAVAFASRSTTNFNSAAILHASALEQQMGPRAFPILWVTGTNDPLYGPDAAEVSSLRASLLARLQSQ